MIRIAALTILLIGSAPAFAADDWIDLLAGKPGETWQTVDQAWIVSDAVALDPEKPNRLKATAVTGGTVWVNGPGRVKDLITKQKFGDCDVHVEFLIAKGSNSGIKFHALYEIQIFDSYGKKEPLSGKEMGGIYPRAQNNPYKYLDEGIGPKVNACKKPGEWQTLTATFRAARFDDKGEKTKNAVMVKAELNGQLIHENVELKHPTGSNWVKKESPTGPFMLQADHGPVAVRVMKIRAIK